MNDSPRELYAVMAKPGFELRQHSRRAMCLSIKLDYLIRAKL